MIRKRRSGRDLLVLRLQPAGDVHGCGTRDAFYPVVRDDYRDTVLFRWRQDRGACASISVVNADGRTVRTATPYRFRGLNGWTWNGKKDNGDLVAKRRYRIRGTVDSNMVSAGVTVATGVVTKSYRLGKEGNRVSPFSIRGDCYGQRDSYYQVATIDCWGGHHTKGNYRFAISAGAFDVRGIADLNRNSLDICCQAKITKEWLRPSKRTVALWAEVTGWRSTQVNFVRVTYKKRIRI